MTLIAQSFLPVVNRSTAEILGLVSIPQTTFTGAELSYTLGGIFYPLTEITIFTTTVRTPVSYMSISLTDYEVRTGQHNSVPGFIPIDTFFQQEYLITISGFSGNNLPSNQTQLLTILTTGAMKIVSSAVLPGPIVPATPRIWNLTATLSTAAACTFFDLPFTSPALYLNNLSALSIALSIPTPSGIVENFLKIYTFADPAQPMTLNGQSNVLRFIKLTAGTIPSGVYSYVVTATLEGGITELTTLNLTIN